jgi:surface carbohydrate biosynthesis protein
MQGLERQGAMPKHRILYMPIETKTRELLGKSFLAARAVERGWIVIMGAQKDTREYMRGRPAGVYVEMSIPDRKIPRLEQIRKDGHRIVNLCEESAFYTSAEDYCARKLGAGSLELVDRLLTPGERNARDVRAFRPASDGKVAVTGNPRFDILLPGLRCIYGDGAEAIRRDHGSFILVNSNFARINPYAREQDTVDRWLSKGLINEGSEVEFLRSHASFKRRQMEGLQALLKTLAGSAGGAKIVFRPHPGEDRELWRQWAKPLNIEVRHEGSANAWMMAADAVLHPGCTTGIEGLLLDRPVFSYVPEPTSEFINEPDLVSQWITSAEELVDGVSHVRGLSQDEIRKSFASQRQRLGDYVANMAPPYAADRILDAIGQLDTPEVTPEQAGVTGGLLQTLMRKIRGRLPQKTSSSRAERRWQKLGDIEPHEIKVPLTTWVGAGVLAELPQMTRFNSRLVALH